VHSIEKVVIKSMKKPSLMYFWAISLRSVISSTSLTKAVVNETKILTIHRQSIAISIATVCSSTSFGSVQIL
jgi:hypothetical protein